MSSPNLSIIIPVGPGRNARAALTSLQKAGLAAGDEVIVVGDGHIVAVPTKFGDLPLRLESLETSEGANAARNRGAAVARNPYLCFLDDDDAYLPDALEVLKRRLLEKGDAKAWSLGWIFRSGRAGWSQRRPVWLTEPSLRKRNLAGGCSSMVLAKEAFEAADGFDADMPSMQDWDLWLRVVRDKPIRVVPHVCVLYQDSVGGRISTDAVRRIDGLRRLLKKYGKFWSAAERAFHESRIAAIAFSARQGDFAKIFRWRAPLASGYFMVKSLMDRSRGNK